MPRGPILPEPLDSKAQPRKSEPGEPSQEWHQETSSDVLSAQRTPFSSMAQMGGTQQSNMHLLCCRAEPQHIERPPSRVREIRCTQNDLITHAELEIVSARYLGPTHRFDAPCDSVAGWIDPD